jgi:hypothetical protein
VACFVLLANSGAATVIDVVEANYGFRVVLVHTDEDLAMRTMHLQKNMSVNKNVLGTMKIPGEVAGVVETIKAAIIQDYGCMPGYIRIATPSDPLYLKTLNELFRQAGDLTPGQAPESGTS